jgi:hypothetical protein
MKNIKNISAKTTELSLKFYSKSICIKEIKSKKEVQPRKMKLQKENRRKKNDP